MNETLCACGKEKAFDEDKCPDCKKIKKAVIVKKKVKKVTSQAVAPQQAMSPSIMISEAVKNGSDLAQLRELLSLQKDWEANEAKKAYHLAMASFKENPPRVTKDKKNSQFNSTYTTLGNLINTVNPELSKQGFSARWDIEQNGSIKVTCIMTHKFGHSETASASADKDTSGAKNSVQQIKSTITYLKSVTFESICGIASTDANLDDDGNGVLELISEKELHVIRDYLLAAHAEEGKFCKYLKVETLEELPKSDYKKAISALLSKIGKGK